MESRTPTNEMLDAMTFAEIRAECATDHPRDVAARNECEMDRMTAARLETE
jgi:hypothetical protein